MQNGIQTLLDVMKCLRDPETGCAWDVQQDFKSIAQYTIEEAYEVVDAIEHGNTQDFKEELGDLLLQVVFHAQMANEEGLFDFDTVAQAVADKMVSRHPHVFGDLSAQRPEDVDVIWDQQKDKENSKNQRTLDDVTLGLPALMRAQKLQKRAARVGFEWPDSDAALEKLDEEIAELKAAKAANDLENLEEEIGDVMFCLVNYARMNGINSEEALRKINNKFTIRFNGLEEDLKVKNMKVQDASLPELLELWQKQKEK